MHGFPEKSRFVGEEPVPKLGVLKVGVVERARTIRLHDLTFSDWRTQPTIEELA